MVEKAMDQFKLPDSSVGQSAATSHAFSNIYITMYLSGIKWLYKDDECNTV